MINCIFLAKFGNFSQKPKISNFEFTWNGTLNRNFYEYETIY